MRTCISWHASLQHPALAFLVMPAHSQHVYMSSTHNVAVLVCAYSRFSAMVSDTWDGSSVCGMARYAMGEWISVDLERRAVSSFSVQVMGAWMHMHGWYTDACHDKSCLIILPFRHTHIATCSHLCMHLHSPNTGCTVNACIPVMVCSISVLRCAMRVAMVVLSA